MTNEPEKNIEQRLQDYAQQRREEAGAPLELHAVNRNLLQEEVARTYAPAAEPAKSAEPTKTEPVNWLAQFWPRLAFGSAIFASLAFVVYAVLMDTRLRQQAPAADREAHAAPQFLAKNDKKLSDEMSESRGYLSPLTSAAGPAPAPAKAEASVDAFRAAPAPAGPPAVAVRTDGVDANGRLENEKRILIAGEAKEADQAARPGKMTPLESANAFKDAADRAPKETQIAQLAASPPAAPSPMRELAKAKAAPAPKPSATDAETRLEKSLGAVVPTNAPKEANDPAANRIAGTQLRFKQIAPEVTYRRNFNSPPFRKVMTSFQLELAGETVRIIDADGSIYEGKLTGDTGEADKQAEATSRGRGNSGGELAFEAKGLNRTLKQQVIFRGTFLVAEVSGLEDQMARKRDAGGPRPAVVTQSARGGEVVQRAGRQLQNTQVRGRATVGGRNQYDINAVTAP